jgi:hypothetical protein
MGSSTAGSTVGRRSAPIVSIVEHWKRNRIGARQEPVPTHPMEAPMTRIISSTARRTLTATLAALILASTIPQAGFAQTSSSDGVWKIDLANSQFGPRSSTLRVARDGQGLSHTANPVVVISKGNVYLATGAPAQATLSSKAFQTVGYAGTGSGKLVLIGMNAHARDYCAFRCQLGLADGRPMTLTFKTVGGSEQQINNMLAANAQKQ